MYYLERLMEWFYDLDWKLKALLALVFGTLAGIGSAVGGPVIAGVVIGLLAVDFITDDILDVHGQ
jgi:hypothetical protein